LQATARQVENEGTPATTYYVYDAAGQRVRKVTEHQAAAGQTPTLMKERIYLGGFEIYREYGNDSDTVKLERETLHIMDDKQRVALVETRTLDTAGNDPASQQLIRYQFGNHLGSASLELDDQARIISYEEYYPYGSTSYQAVRSQTETPKRYRYTGKERDEETGFTYHGARYYAPWLERWVSPDPIGMEDGINIYAYVHGKPTIAIDPTGMWWWVIIPILLTDNCDPAPANAPGPNTKTFPSYSTGDVAQRWAVALASGLVGAKAGHVAIASLGSRGLSPGASRVGGYALGGGTASVANTAGMDLVHGQISSPGQYATSFFTGAFIGGGMGVLGRRSLASSEIAFRGSC
jgi:RHS repeat-associated protein